MAKIKVAPKKKATFNKRNQFIVVSVVAILIVVSLVAFEYKNINKPNKKKNNNDNNDIPPETGNWIVDKEILIEGKDLVLNGNLTIVSGGSLRLQNSTLKIGSTEMEAIKVHSGGQLRITYSTLLFEGSPTPYILRASDGSVLVLHKSQIPFEVIVNTTGTYIDGNTFTGKFSGLNIASSKAMVVFNTIKGTDNPMMDAGITIENGTKNTISHNVISGFGIGIALDRSNNNTIFANNISATTSGSGGAGFQFMNSYDNEASFNEFTKCSVALNLIGSRNNKFHHNNFLDNTKQVQDDASNKFDDGSFGNFWSDYIGFDLNKDGKGDLPYIINLSDRDNHPSMKLVPRP